MTTLHYLTHRPDEVLDALRRGEIVALETATEEMPDFFLLYAIESDLLDQLADTFPDPRQQQPEIPMRLLLAGEWQATLPDYMPSPSRPMPCIPRACSLNWASRSR